MGKARTPVSLIPYAKRQRKNSIRTYCNVPNCARMGQLMSLCIKHYSALKRELNRTGQTIPRLPLLDLKPMQRIGYTCAICPKPHKAKGYCSTHHKSMRRREQRANSDLHHTELRAMYADEEAV